MCPEPERIIEKRPYEIVSHGVYRRGTISTKAGICESFCVATTPFLPLFGLAISSFEGYPQATLSLPGERCIIVANSFVLIPPLKDGNGQGARYKWDSLTLEEPLEIRTNGQSYYVHVSKDGNRATIKITGDNVFFSVEDTQTDSSTISHDLAMIQIKAILNMAKIEEVIASADNPDSVLTITARSINPVSP